MCCFILCRDGTDFYLLLLMMLVVAQTTQHWMIARLTNNWKQCRRKWSQPNFRYYPGTHLKKTRKTTKKSKHFTSQLRFGLCTSRMQVKSITASVTSSVVAAPTIKPDSSAINYWIILIFVCYIYHVTQVQTKREQKVQKGKQDRIPSDTLMVRSVHESLGTLRYQSGTIF